MTKWLNIMCMLYWTDSLLPIYIGTTHETVEMYVNLPWFIYNNYERPLNLGSSLRVYSKVKLTRSVFSRVWLPMIWGALQEVILWRFRERLDTVLVNVSKWHEMYSYHKEASSQTWTSGGFPASGSTWMRDIVWRFLIRTLVKLRESFTLWWLHRSDHRCFYFIRV